MKKIRDELKKWAIDITQIIFENQDEGDVNLLNVTDNNVDENEEITLYILTIKILKTP